MRLIVNKNEMKKWAKSVGGASKAARMIMDETEVSVSTADKLVRGIYPSEPDYLLRKVLCELTGLAEDALFNKVEDNAS